MDNPSAATLDNAAEYWKRGVRQLAIHIAIATGFTPPEVLATGVNVLIDSLDLETVALLDAVLIESLQENKENA